MGLGTHLNAGRNYDISVSSQYMIHLGTHIDIDDSGSSPLLSKSKGVNLEGHLLFTISINYKLGYLWYRR